MLYRRRLAWPAYTTTMLSDLPWSTAAFLGRLYNRHANRCAVVDGGFPVLPHNCCAVVDGGLSGLPAQYMKNISHLILTLVGISP
jgi:hypothetical protein